MLMGYDNGEVHIRHVDGPNKYLQIKMHDGQQGAITSVRLDKEEKYVMTTAEDGLMFIYQIDSKNLKKEALYDPFAGVEGIDFMPEATKDELRAEKTAGFFNEN
jgi:WD40 repeat protein